MAPSLRAFASAAGTGTSQTVTVPAATEGGDWLVLCVMAGATPTQPSGWTRIDSQTGSGMAGRIFTKKAAGSVGAVSTDAGASVVCAVASAAPTQVYLAVVRDAAGVYLRGATRSSTQSLVLLQTHPAASAFMLAVAATRVTAPTTLSISASSTTIHNQNTDASIAGLLASRTGPITSSSSLSTSIPSANAGSYVATVVAWDTPTDTVFDHSFTPPPSTDGIFDTPSTVKTVSGTFESSVEASVKALWAYIVSPSQAGQTLTAAVWSPAAATSPLVTAAIDVTKTGWLRIPLTSWPRISAATQFVVSVSFSGLNITQGNNPPHQFPFSYNRLTLVAARTSTSATVPINPATNATADFFIDAEITTDTAIEIVGGGRITAGPTPISTTISGGGEITSRVPLPVDISGGGTIATIAWPTDFPSEDVPDIDPVDFTDPDLYEEPPVLQSTVEMPDPVTIVDGVPVDWEPL